MKKRLLSFFMATAAVAVYAQPMFYVNDVDVKVEENTLVYVGGAFEKTSTIANDGKVTNDGNIYVNGDFTNASSEDFFLLTNKNSDNSTYGQLIIDDAATVTGKVSLTRQLASGQDFIQIAFPFTDATGNSVISDMELAATGAFTSCNANAGLCGPRYINSLLYWVNDEVLFETVSDGTSLLDPSLYYILNVVNRHSDAEGKLVTLTGTPSNAVLSIGMTAMDDLFAPADVNKYSERYSAYQEDIALGTDLTNANWGENQYQFANPYTSNLDLSFIGFNETGAAYENDGNALSGLQAAAFAASTASGTDEARTTALGSTKIGFGPNGQKATGDVATPFVIEPTVPFLLKFDDTNATQNLALGDPNKVFADEDRAASDAGGVASMSEGTSSVNNSVNQVGISVLDDQGEYTGNRFYVAASDLFTDTMTSSMELGATMPNNGMYTIQEASDGSIRSDQADKPLFVNGVSNEFVGVAIPVGLNIDEENPLTSYTIKTAFRSVDGLLLENGQEFNTGHNFIFHDKELNEIMVMDDSFEYTFTQTEDTNSRFEIFYGEIPSFLDTSNVLASNNTTKVYKDGRENYSIRFSQDELGDTATVTVFNSVGQLIANAANVPTDVDHNLNLAKSGSSLYVVRIEGDNGTVVTKKVIF